MAFFDDPNFLISHIRNSYITSDDTGMCELIMANEDSHCKLWQKGVSRFAGTTSESGDFRNDFETREMAHSFGIASDMDLGAHRRRSNTAQRLDRMKKERQGQANTKHVQWKENPEPLSDEEYAQLFQKKDVTVHEVDKRTTSLLSDQINSFPTLPNNPFNEFAKFDGNAYVGVPTKKIKIFLSMLPEDQRSYPMPVTVIATAKVQELIGLTCWKYKNEGREPQLKDTTDYYRLHIAEDDGEVDTDFPSLDNREIISKFGFSVLALVQKDSPDKLQDEICITVHIPNEPVATITISSSNILLREILEKALQRRQSFVNVKGLEYQLEKFDEQGISLDLDLPLDAVDTLEFFLVRANSKRFEEPGEDRPHKGIFGVDAPLYHSYRVSLLSKVRPKTSIHLGISGEKIEIHPVQNKSATKLPWSKVQKPALYDTDSIVACHVTEEKYTGKTVFRLVYQTGATGQKYHDLEAENSLAKEIVQKVNTILEMRSSPVRRDYVANRANKWM